MPVRKPKEQQKDKYKYSYEDLLIHIRGFIDKEFGGVASMLQSDEYKEFGFKDTPNERSKMFTYLSIPAEGERARVRSFPVLKILYKKLLNIELDSKIKVVREQTLTSNTEI